MRSRILLAIVFVVACTAGMGAWPGWSSGDLRGGEASADTTGTTTAAELTSAVSTPGLESLGSLTVTGMQVLDGGQQEQDAEQAKLASPEAVTARHESRTKFQNLSGVEAQKLASEAFPEVIDSRAGALPPMPSGQHVLRYLTDNAAQVELPGGKYGVIESTEPIALKAASGEHESLDLDIDQGDGMFAPVRSGTGLTIPKRLTGGVRLTNSGISLTPINENGNAIGGAEGVIDGATVLYANTQTNSDTVVKPLADGFEEDTLLRSANSPSRLEFRVGLPAGASLVETKDGSGAVEVVDAGMVIAVLPVATAQDAEGTSVPVAMSVSGDTLTLDVAQEAKEYRYPIDVDPTAIEKGGYEEEVLYGKTWNFYPEKSSLFEVKRLEEGVTGFRFLEDVVSKSILAGERGFFYYRTQGLSRIYEITAHTSFNGNTPDEMEDVVGIENVHTGKAEAKQSWIGSYAASEPVCVEAGCAAGSVNEANDESEVFFEQDARETSESNGGTAVLQKATVDIAQEVGPTTSFVPKENWINNKEHNFELSLTASDPGIGIYSSEWAYHGGPSEWNPKVAVIGCEGVQCEESESIHGRLEGLPEGEDAIEAVTKDAAGLSSTAKTTVKIDNKPPYNLTVLGLPANHEISFGHYVLKISATDGSGTTVSSGVTSIALSIDGKEVGTPRGYCSPGPCTATGEWSINGEEYAAGKHTLTIVAKDGAGNIEKEEFPFTITSSESKNVGPGLVDLTSGAYTLEATDVSIAAPGGGLSVRRSYNSRQLTAGAEGPLGPQWSGLGLGDTQNLTKLPTGSMLLTAANGSSSVFAKESSGFVAPSGDLNMTLKETATNVFTLTERNGVVTTFTLPSGGSGTLFTPHTREEPGIAGAVQYTYQTVGGITEPTQALAPVPAGVSCTTLVKGCRALTFSYSTSTTATGENESEWGEDAGRLHSISFVAWDPSKSEMTTTAVAQYSYDKQGRLRAEWNPRISPALKVMYGYDAEGHVVALTSPGQETWAFTYTNAANDPNTGRLLKADLAPASTTLWNGQALTNTAVPALSGTPMVGVRMAVSNGSWSNGPVTYGYQWKRCSNFGNECVPIVGAVNANYTPVEADIGHTLAATITAINGDGSATATTAVSGLVSANGAPLYTSTTYTSPAEFGQPSSVALTPSGDVWVADASHNRIAELSIYGEFVRQVGYKGSGAGQFSDPHALTVDSKGNVWVADTGNNRIQELNEKGEYVRSVEGSGTHQLKDPGGVTIDSSGDVWVADTGNHRVVEFNEKGEYQSEFATPPGEAPNGIAVSSGYVWVTTTGEGVLKYTTGGTEVLEFSHVGNGGWEGIQVSEGHVWIAEAGRDHEANSGDVLEFTENGSFVKEVGRDEFNVPEGVAVTSGGTVWVADTLNGRIVELREESSEYKVLASYRRPGTMNGEIDYPLGVAIDAKGDTWIDGGNAKIDEYNEKGEYVTQFGTKGTGAGQLEDPYGIAIDPKNNIWIVDNGNGRVEEFNEKGEYQRQFGSEGAEENRLKYPSAIALDAKGDVWVADSGNNRVEEFNEKGEFLQKFGKEGSGEGMFKAPSGIAVDNKGHVWVSDTGNNRLEEFGEKGEFIRAVGKTGTGNAQFERPWGIVADSSGNVWVADTANNRVQELSSEGVFEAKFGSSAEDPGEGPGEFDEPIDLALNSNGDMWISDMRNGREQHWKVYPKTEAEAITPAPGSTVSYGVPVSGTGAPNAMSSTEVEKWGQKDDPIEATAIFPPDEPQTAPASDYRRATVFYMDNRGRTVNVASPGGAIATSEYNSTNDVVRTLSPDNRARALKEGGSGSSELSKLLDTEDTYNSEGTELVSTLGPQHTIKLASGSQIEARDHKQYYYEEGAPSEGGPYDLVTKVTDGAQYSGKEEDVRTTTTSYSGQSNLGWKLRRPTSVTTDPNGLKLTHTIVYEKETGNVVETQMPGSSAKGGSSFTYASQFGNTGSEAEKLSHPNSAAIDAHGNVWITNAYSKVSEYSSSGVFIKGYGSYGTAIDQFKTPLGIAINHSTGNIYIGDEENNRIDELNEKGEFVRAFGWGVSNGESKLESCTTSCQAGKAGSGGGQFDEPQGVAIDSSGNVWVTDYANDRLDEFSEKGEFIKDIGFGVSNEKDELETCKTETECHKGTPGAGNGQFSGPAFLVYSGGDIYVTDLGNDRVEELSLAGAFVGKWGTKGSGNGEFNVPAGISADASGNIYVADLSNSRVQEFSSAGAFEMTFGTHGSGNGQLSEPEGVAITSAGNVDVVDSANSRVEVWISGNGNPEAHDTRTIYYSSAANSEFKNCGEHPEWANLPCQTGPVAQPGTAGLPELPVTTYTYNVLDEPLTTTETVGSTTRTKTATYDTAGRLKTSAISSTVGTALPTVTYEYNKETGALEKQSTTTEGKTKTITSVYNTVGELTSYTDADENTATYEYDIDGRTTKVNDGKGTQTYTYESTTGDLSKLVDSTAGTFTGTYDVEGNLLTEGYPNGMNANYTYNSVDSPIDLEYIKTTHCAEKCTWFSDSVVPSIHGQWLEQTSTLSHQAYTYDAAGRLTQVQNTPTGKGCTTRVYTYDEDTNRLNLATHEPGTKGECTSTGGTEEKHSYDSADRLTDVGTTYNTFGDITNLPAADAGGSELTSSYYTDNQVASETQNGQTVGFNLDPAGRTLETVKTGKVATTIISHYAGPGSEPTWTVNTGGEWTRNIGGITGALAAVQNGTEAPVLQIENLHGDIVATAYLSETASGLASTEDTSEYGVPTLSMPPKYSWLGASEIPTELASGVMAMGARSYVPQLGRFLQPDPRPGGSANAYAYTFGDPVNSSDPSGEYTLGGPSQALINGTAEMASDAAAEQAAINAAARAEAERKAEEDAVLAAMAGPQYEGEEEWEEGEEGEEEYEEYAAYRPESKGSHDEMWLEGGLISEPFGEGAPSEGNGRGGGGEALTRLCEPGSSGPCVLPVGKKKKKKTTSDPGASRECYNSEGRIVKTKTPQDCRYGYPGDGKANPEAKERYVLDCPDGSSPGISLITGKVACLPDGDNPSEDSNDDDG